MARVTFVKAAQQRYATIPVIDPETGQQMIRVQQRKRPTKRGATETRVRVTQEDRTRPLPPETCDHCHKPIEVGTPYKWIKPKSGPYGGRKRSRHAACPTWQVWDYSSSLSAQLARIDHDARTATEGAEAAETVTSALENAAQEIRDLAEQKREGADNIREGFGHDTFQSEELDQTADDLESWADEVEEAGSDLGEPADYACDHCTEGKSECGTCDGTGTVEDGYAEDGAEVPCDDCGGTGETECDYCDGDGQDPEAWSEAVENALSVLDNCPV